MDVVALSPLAAPQLTSSAPNAVTPVARRALVGSAVGYAMDRFDLLILGFMLGAIRAGLGLDAAQAASLVIATLIGAVIGGIVFGIHHSHAASTDRMAWHVRHRHDTGDRRILYPPSIGGAVMGFFVNGMLGGYGAPMSELYPTVARATAQNVLFNIRRAIGGFGPVVVAAIATICGVDTAIALLVVIYLVDMLAMWLLIPEHRGSARQ